jgi:hypothetical protein
VFCTWSDNNNLGNRSEGIFTPFISQQMFYVLLGKLSRDCTSGIKKDRKAEERKYIINIETLSKHYKKTNMLDQDLGLSELPFLKSWMGN